MAGFPLNTFTAWLRGERVPGGDALKKLCTAFGVSSDYLLGLTDDPHASLSAKAAPPAIGRPVPVVSLAAAEMYDPTLSNLCELWDGIDDTIVYVGPTTDAVFAIKIQGDSMSPVLQDGDIVAVTERLPATGNICLVKHARDGILCKRWFWRDGLVKLESINPQGRSYAWTREEFAAEHPIVWRFKVEALIYRPFK